MLEACVIDAVIVKIFYQAKELHAVTLGSRFLGPHDFDDLRRIDPSWLLPGVG